jgi:hypothetical protein
MPHKTAVATFLNTHTDFEFSATNIKSYLVKHEDTAFKGVDDRQGFTDQLEKMQRVAHVAPRYDQMRALLTAKLDSAQSIASLSRERFQNDYKDELGGINEAAKVHDAAIRDSCPEIRVLSISDPCSLLTSILRT